MTAIVEIPVGHFSGQRAIPNKPGGDDNRSLEDLIRELQQAANSGGQTGWTDDQRTAATEIRGFIAPADGEVTYIASYNKAAAAAGETIEVEGKINGTRFTAAAIALDDSDSTNVVEGTLDTGAVAFSQGDKITIERTYAAGGGPTPLENVTTVGLRFSE